MKYSTQIALAVPRHVLVEKLDNPENMKHWQRGLIGYAPISGTPGTEAAQMELQYLMGKRQVTLVETILKNNLPDELHTTYDTKGVHNVQRNYFKEVDEHNSLWISESEFHFSGLGMRLMSWLMPGMFKKQSLQYMQDFKAFCEQGISVVDD